jgi:hypothetical protein
MPLAEDLVRALQQHTCPYASFDGKIDELLILEVALGGKINLAKR